MAGGARQTVERRQLGLMLQTMRLRSDKSQHEAATVIGRDHTRISLVESGKSSLKAEELAKLLDFYGASQEERETVLRLGVEARRRQRRRVYTDVLPEAFQRFSDLQAVATEISYYECSVLPGLIQSPGYVRAIIEIGNGVWWETSSEEVEARIAFRLKQQERVLTADPPKKLRFVFTEEALRHEVGGSPIMQAAIIHVLQLIEHHPKLDIQIIPSAVNNIPALGGGLAVLDFAGAPRICFASTLYGPYTYHDHEQDTVPMARAFAQVQSLALSTEESRALLIRSLKETK